LSFSDRRSEHGFDDLSLEMLHRAWHEDLALLVILVNDSGIRARELRGPSHDGAQDGAEIQGGRDRLTDLAERPKLTHRASQGLGLCFEFLEQSDVFDGDDGLIGEGLEELDLLVRKRPALAPADGDRSDRLIVAQQWDHENALEPHGLKLVLVRV